MHTKYFSLCKCPFKCVERPLSNFAVLKHTWLHVYLKRELLFAVIILSKHLVVEKRIHGHIFVWRYIPRKNQAWANQINQVGIHQSMVLSSRNTSVLTSLFVLRPICWRSARKHTKKYSIQGTWTDNALNAGMSVLSSFQRTIWLHLSFSFCLLSIIS